MRRFIAFFRRFRVFLIFLLLQVVALSFYFSVMNYAQTQYFNTSNSIIGTLLTWERNIVKYLYLDEANRQLQEENARLEKQFTHNYIAIDDKSALINDTIYELSYERIPATVINSSHQFADNYFTINAGKIKGIQKNMGVVSSEGVVGIVYDVSKHFAVVKSILTNNINISAYINGTNAFGLIKYEKSDPRRVQLTGISNDIKLKKGSRVNTRGSAGYFPVGTPIGIIESIQEIEGKPLWDITVRLQQDMRKLHYVYVIKNIHQLELEEIEEDYKELQ